MTDGSLKRQDKTCGARANGHLSSSLLVVVALSPVLRWEPGRNPGDNDNTTRHLSGRSIRVLAIGLAWEISKPDDDTGMRSGENAVFRRTRLFESVLLFVLHLMVFWKP
jgi:hypothetical protein